MEVEVYGGVWVFGIKEGVSVGAQAGGDKIEKSLGKGLSMMHFMLQTRVANVVFKQNLAIR